MATLETQQITIRLEGQDELFLAPQFAPFQGKIEQRSGVDRIVAELQPRGLVKPLHTTIEFSAQNLNDGMYEECRKALALYCDSKMAQLDIEQASVRRRGIKALQFGLIFLAACLLLSNLFDSMRILPEFLNHFLGEGFVIVGWVVLWHPVELLIFEQRLLVRDKQVYQCIRDMKLSVIATSS